MSQANKQTADPPHPTSLQIASSFWVFGGEPNLCPLGSLSAFLYSKNSATVVPGYGYRQSNHTSIKLNGNNIYFQTLCNIVLKREI